MKKKRIPFYELSGTPEGQNIAKSLSHALKSAPHPLRLDDILRLTGISRRLKKDVLAELHAQANAGTLVHLHGGAWASAASLKTVLGTLAIQRSGAAFVTPVGATGGQKNGQDIYIAPEAVGDAWNGDEVEVTLLPGRRGPASEGRVMRVIRRGQQELTVRVIRPPRKSRMASAGEENSEDTPSFYERALCRPADPRLNFDMLTDVSALPETPQKDELLRVTVGERLPSPPDNQLWSGTALVSLGKEDDVAVQEQLTKLNHLIPSSFPDDVLAEAEVVAQDTLQGMSDNIGSVTDLRSLPLVTIDGEDARDFDDAVLVTEDGSGWRLVVAIADVSHYVLPRSRLDREALERGNSYYFPTSVEPMLPEALSNGVCSLRPGEDRRVMVADMDIDAHGNPKGAKFYAGIMRSAARLTYHQAQAMLDGDAMGDKADGLSPAVRAMVKSAGKLAATLIERRRKQGGLDFDLPEAEFVTEDGRVTAVRNRERLFSHRLIEAFMVAANEAVATWLTKKKTPLLYRVHPEPSPEKLESLIRALRATELPLPLPHKEQGKDSGKSASSNAAWLPALLAAAAQTEQSYLVGRLTLRSMMQARYSPELEGHFGLASTCYCHFTSPIRRYADLVTHRALKEALGLDPGGAIPVGHKLLAVAEACNGREQAAQDAEREITRRLGCLLLQNRVGEEFHGVISGVTHFGLFVELEHMPLEGMIRVETLGQDYFEFDADRQELRGNDTGVAFRLGEAVDVRLAEVNVGRLEITLLLTGTPDSALDGRRRSPRGRENRGGEQRRDGSFHHTGRHPARHADRHTGGRDQKTGTKGGPPHDPRPRQGNSAEGRKTSRRQGQNGGQRGR